MEYLATFAQNVGLLSLGAVSVFLFVDRFGLPQDSFRRNLFTGLVFGLVSVLVIEFPVKGPVGTTFDTRAAPVLIVGYLAGPFAGSIVAVFGAAARYHVGGPYALGGALSPFLYLAAALIMRRLFSHAELNLRRLLVLAALGTVVVTPAFFVSRSLQDGFSIVVSSWPLVLVGNVIGVMLLGVIFQHMRDQIARRQQLEFLTSELTSQLDATKRANQSKDIFLANMSHELRTPLNAIIGFAGMIETHSEEDVSRQRVREYAKDIRESGSTLATLINDVLDVSKMEAGEVDIRMERVECAKIVDEVCGQLSPLADQKRMVLERDFNPDSLAMMDTMAFKQCLINVVGNAIKYAPAGTAITLSGSLSDDLYIVRIEDQGAGIHKDLKERVGEPFLRGGDPYTRNIEGTGLGLAITKMLMERQNGRMEIRDGSHGGTEVLLALQRSKD